MSTFTDRLKELAPHYLIMVAIMLGVLLVVEWFLGDIGFWARLAIAFVVVIIYPISLRRLGRAPEAWQ